MQKRILQVAVSVQHAKVAPAHCIIICHSGKKNVFFFFKKDFRHDLPEFSGLAMPAPV